MTVLFTTLRRTGGAKPVPGRPFNLSDWKYRAHTLSQHGPRIDQGRIWHPFGGICQYDIRSGATRKNRLNQAGKRGMISAVNWGRRRKRLCVAWRTAEREKGCTCRGSKCRATARVHAVGQIRLSLQKADMAKPLATPGKNPPRVIAAKSKEVCMWKTLNGPSEKPADDPLLLPPRERPKRTGNHSTSGTPPHRKDAA